MKKIEAIVEPSEIGTVREALTELGVGGITATEIHDFGASGGRTLVYRGRKVELPYTTEAKLEVAVADETADRVVAILQRAAKTDQAGEARVLTFSLDEAALKTAKKNIAVV